MFDFIKFCGDYNIQYFMEGKNWAQGWIQIQCPFCYDSSSHLGFNVEKDYLNCWQCGYKSLYKFVKKITNENPLRIIEKYSKANIIRENLNKKLKKKTGKLIIPGQKLQKRHKNYLKSRNFDPDYLEKKYDLRGTDHLNKYKFRIVIPIYYQNKIVSFQTRDITNQQQLRYKSCKKDDEIIHHKHLLYNLDNCEEDYVIVVEGIFDVWRIEKNCCCTFGTGYTNEQLNLLKKYKRIYIIFDNELEAQQKAHELALKLDSMGVEAFNISLDEGKDPANLIQKEVDELLKNID